MKKSLGILLCLMSITFLVSCRGVGVSNDEQEGRGNPAPASDAMPAQIRMGGAATMNEETFMGFCVYEVANPQSRFGRIHGSGAVGISRYPVAVAGFVRTFANRTNLSPEIHQIEQKLADDFACSDAQGLCPKSGVAAASLIRSAIAQNPLRVDDERRAVMALVALLENRYFQADREYDRVRQAFYQAPPAISEPSAGTICTGFDPGAQLDKL